MNFGLWLGFAKAYSAFTDGYEIRSQRSEFGLRIQRLVRGDILALLAEKRQMQKWILIPVCVILNGCGALSGVLSMRLVLPAGLQRGAGRFERLIQRAARLEVHTTVDDVRETAVFPLSSGGRYLLSHYTKPPDGETLSFEVEVWDLKKDGMPRDFPVLAGKKKLSAEEIRTVKEIAIPLHLAVPASEYD